MQTLLYWFGKIFVTIIQSLPIGLVARIGRLGGGLAYRVDARHRRVAIDGLSKAFPEKSADEIRQIAHENFRRIGESGGCGIKVASMSPEKVLARCEIIGLEKLTGSIAAGNRIFAVGHFGSFEVLAFAGSRVPGYRIATTYRGIPSPAFNRLMQEVRSQTGALFFERRSGIKQLMGAMRKKGILLGLFCDQHGGQRGAWGDFLGRDCSTNMAPAVLALRYEAPLNVGVSFRIAPARWRIEVSDEIPRYENGVARAPEAVMRDVNAVFEEAVRRDPANWFWVHRRWRARPPKRTESVRVSGADLH